MNWDRIAGNWRQFKGKVRERWGFLTDDELEAIAGNREALVGKIVEHYGLTKDRAEQAVEQFLREIDKAA